MFVFAHQQGLILTFEYTNHPYSTFYIFILNIYKIQNNIKIYQKTTDWS